jgi:uncharacterized protein (TIGR01244 family)
MEQPTNTLLRVFTTSLLYAAWVAVLIVVGGWACGSNNAEKTSNESPNSMESTLAPDSAGPEGVVNYTRVDATVACAGATPPEAMAGLKELGFISVINFRTEGERGAMIEESRTAAEAAGLTYFHLPFREATPEVTETFLDTVADPVNQPVYIHCGSANRVGAMWLIKRVRVDGWSVEDAMVEAEAIGLRSEALKEFAIDYVGAGGA